MNKSIVSPRLRANKNTDMVLTTSWQDVVFNGTSSFNINTFGIDPASGKRMVDYTSSPNLFRFYELYDRNYQVTLFTRTTSTTISTGITLQYRLVVPNGVSQGVDLYFPFPESEGSADLAQIAIRTGSVSRQSEPIPMYLNTAIKTNGIKLQLRLSTALGVGTVTLNEAIVLIQQ